MAIGFGARVVVKQRNIAAVRVPLDPDLVRLSRGKLQVEIVIPGVPILPPAVEHFAAVDEHFSVARGIEAEAVQPASAWDDRAGPLDLEAGYRPAIVHGARAARPVLAVLEVLKVDRRLSPFRDDLAADGVGRTPPLAAVDL